MRLNILRSAGAFSKVYSVVPNVIIKKYITFTMRLGFYQQLILGSVFAATAKHTKALQMSASLAKAERNDNLESELMLAQSADVTQYEQDFYNTLAQVDSHSHARSHSSSESSSSAEASSGSGSSSSNSSSSFSSSESSDSDDFSNEKLMLAQQLQELNYLNALGTINAAQVQAVQQMGAMSQMGLMGGMGGGQMGGGMGGGMPQMGGMGGGMPGQSFAQISAEDLDDDLTARDLYLAQLAATVSTLSGDSVDQIETMLA